MRSESEIEPVGLTRDDRIVQGIEAERLDGLRRGRCKRWRLLDLAHSLLRRIRYQRMLAQLVAQITFQFPHQSERQRTGILTPLQQP
jgi:hypothetical protein